MSDSKIKCTKRGDRVIATIDGETFSTAHKDIADYEKLKENIKNYNTKPTKKLLSEIKKVFASKKAAKEEKKESLRNQVKATTKVVKTSKPEVESKAKAKQTALQRLEEEIKSGKVKQEDLERLSSLINQTKKIEEPKSVTSAYRRPGEN